MTAPELPIPPPAGPLGRIATRALEWAAGLPPVGPGFLAERLYRFHSLPRSSEPLLLPDPSVLARAGGWSLGKRVAGPWLGLGRAASSGPQWKLYLSPFPDRLTEVAMASLPILARAGATFAKLGRHPETVLRPDRFVAYFRAFAPLRAAARELESALAGVPAHGVPFTAQLDRIGLLSWGLDAGPMSRSGETLSWRHRITAVLGRALFHARRTGLSREAAVQFARRRLALEGVDPVHFAPRDDPAESADGVRR